MEYWNNPIKTYTWPCAEDPIVESFHNGQHCLFYDSNFTHLKITYNQKLQDLCNWINDRLHYNSIKEFIADKRNHYEIANIVKLNMWTADIKVNGIVKPMLVTYHDDKYMAHNGESRLRVLENLPEIKSVRAFINTSINDQQKFSHLEKVTNFNQFASLCNAVDQQKFMFTLTDPTAPYGIFWYEYDSYKTRSVTPGEDACVNAVKNYLDQHPDTKFTIDWFNHLVEWSSYGLIV
jgi:hypothetical protein